MSSYRITSKDESLFYNPTLHYCSIPNVSFVMKTATSKKVVTKKIPAKKAAIKKKIVAKKKPLSKSDAAKKGWATRRKNAKK